MGIGEPMEEQISSIIIRKFLELLAEIRAASEPLEWPWDLDMELED